jgi:hypothetical protein
LLELLCALGRERAVGGLRKRLFEEMGSLAAVTGGFAKKIVEEHAREGGVLAARIAIAAAGIVAASGRDPVPDAPGQGLEGLWSGSSAPMVGRRRG